MKNHILPLIAVLFLANATLVSCNESDKKAAETEKDSIPESTIDSFCFEMREGLKQQDLTSVKLVIDEDNVSGTMQWQPFEKDGSNGTLKGIKKGAEMFLTYDYLIEGSRQKEDMVFKLAGDTLYRKVGPLKEISSETIHLALRNIDSSLYSVKLNKVTCK